MLVNPDFSDAQDPIEPGEYFVRIEKCEQKTSKNGNAYLNWTLKTFNEEEEKNNDRAMWHTTMLEGRGAGMLKDFVKAATGEPPAGSFDTEELIGRELKVVVGQDSEGRTQIKAVRQVQ